MSKIPGACFVSGKTKRLRHAALVTKKVHIVNINIVTIKKVNIQIVNIKIVNIHRMSYIKDLVIHLY